MKLIFEANSAIGHKDNADEKKTAKTKLKKEEEIKHKESEFNSTYTIIHTKKLKY